MSRIVCAEREGPGVRKQVSSCQCFCSERRFTALVALTDETA